MRRGSASIKIRGTVIRKSFRIAYHPDGLDRLILLPSVASIP
jgi:hypothetical protein